MKDQFNTKKQLNNVGGVSTKSTTETTIGTATKTNNKYCEICNNRYQNKDEHFNSNLHKNIKESKFFKEESKKMKSWVELQ